MAESNSSAPYQVPDLSKLQPGDELVISRSDWCCMSIEQAKELGVELKRQVDRGVKMTMWRDLPTGAMRIRCE